MSHIIAFANNKGGVAKTTSVCNIGIHLARMGQRVLFVDLDSQANLTSLVSDLPAEQRVDDISDAFIHKDKLPIENVGENMDLVPSSLMLSQFESQTASDATRVFVLKDLLEDVKDNYDFILMDCPPALGTITTIALVAAQYLVLVTMPETMSYAGMMMVGGLVKKVQANPRLNPDLQIVGIIITKYRSNRVTNAYVKKIEHEAGSVYLGPIVHEEAAVLKAVVANRRIDEVAPSSKAFKAYEEIAKELYNRVFNI